MLGRDAAEQQRQIGALQQPLAAKQTDLLAQPHRSLGAEAGDAHPLAVDAVIAAGALVCMVVSSFAVPHGAHGVAWGIRDDCEAGDLARLTAGAKDRREAAWSLARNGLCPSWYAAFAESFPESATAPLLQWLGYNEQPTVADRLALCAYLLSDVYPGAAEALVERNSIEQNAEPKACRRRLIPCVHSSITVVCQIGSTFLTALSFSHGSAA